MRQIGFILLVLSASACTGGGDGEPIDLAGTWSMTATPTSHQCATDPQHVEFVVGTTGDGAYLPQLTPPAGGGYQASIVLNPSCSGEPGDCFASIAISEYDASGHYLTTVAGTVTVDGALEGKIVYTVNGTTECNESFEMEGQIE